MWLDCNILLISPEKQNGHIDLIKANEEKMICYDKSSLLFGFGFLKLKATAKADNAAEVKDEKIIGLLVGFLFIKSN